MRRFDSVLATPLSLLACASLVAGIGAVAACSSKDGGEGSLGSLPSLDASTTPLPDESSPPSVYVAKVKSILVGLPPTDEEIASVTADPSKLGGLIDGWMKMPEYQDKMLRFFQLAFQQTQVDITDFAAQTQPRIASNNATTTPLLLQNLTESFARTVLELVAEGRPLTDALTTRSFMMTPPLMEFYGFLDAWQIDDDGKVQDRFELAHPGQQLYLTAANIPVSESVDPKSPNFMHWHNPDLALAEARQAGCGADPIVYTPKANAVGAALHFALEGSIDLRSACPGVSGSPAASPFSPADYGAWKMVKTRPPNGGEAPSDFWDVPKLRASTELVLQVPRVGFFSTPAFFANWQTNDSNQMRVTMNQALIVALGAAVDGTDATHPASTPGLDTAHAGNPACSSCHQTLDPTRSIFSASWSWNYHDQNTASISSQLGLFAFQGVTQPVKSLDDFGATLASHPLFAPAWVQKLCYYANSRACEADDPEFSRIASVFKSSGYSWSTLVRELLSSPLTTNAKPTKTAADQGEVIAVARRDHLCASLNNRLGLTDVCGLGGLAPAKKSPLATVAQIVPGLPSDGYGRGSIAPVLPNTPTFFYRAGTENICEAVAALVVEPAAGTAPAGAKSWSSSAVPAAIGDFVGIVMGLPPSDPRAAPAREVLDSHFAAATKSGATPVDALRSTFTLACLSPSSLSIGL